MNENENKNLLGFSSLANTIKVCKHYDMMYSDTITALLLQAINFI